MGFLHWRLFSRCWDFDMSGESQFSCGQSHTDLHTQSFRDQDWDTINQNFCHSFHISIRILPLCVDAHTLRSTHSKCRTSSELKLDIMPGFNLELVIQNSPPPPMHQWNTLWLFQMQIMAACGLKNIWMISHWLYNSPRTGQVCVNT